MCPALVQIPSPSAPRPAWTLGCGAVGSLPRSRSALLPRPSRDRAGQQRPEHLAPSSACGSHKRQAAIKDGRQRNSASTRLTQILDRLHAIGGRSLFSRSRHQLVHRTGLRGKTCSCGVRGVRDFRGIGARRSKRPYLTIRRSVLHLYSF